MKRFFPVLFSLLFAISFTTLLVLFRTRRLGVVREAIEHGIEEVREVAADALEKIEADVDEVRTAELVPGEAAA
jgi:hypothetical protein